MNDPLAVKNDKNANLRPKRKSADFFEQSKFVVDYRDAETLRRFLSPEGKILPGRRTGLTSTNQRKITRAIKRARMLSLLPFATSEG